MRGVALVTLPAVVAGQSEWNAGDLGHVKTMIQGLQENIGTLHNKDSKLYEEAACHCDSMTKKLSEPSVGQIPVASDNINDAASTIETKTAFKEKSEEDLAKNHEELVTLIQVEKDQLKAWTARKSQLSADIAETTQAANALGAVGNLFNAEEHAELISLVNDMNEDVTGTLKDLNQQLGEGTKQRGDENADFLTNKGSEESQIKQGKIDIADAKSRIGQAKTKMLENESDLKLYSKQLHDLTKYCEDQANDWDKMSAERQRDWGVYSLAINILSCGKEECAGPSSFLQRSLTTARMTQTAAGQKLAIRQLVRLGEKTQNKDLTQLRSLLQMKDPLLPAKQLLRKLIEKLVTEQAMDQGEQNGCVTELTTCTNKRDFALEMATKARLAAEELGQSVEQSKAEFAEKANAAADDSNDASEISHIDIPNLVQAYSDQKDALTQDKSWLQEALVVLRKHFGVEVNSLRADAEASESGMEGDRVSKVGERTTGERGDTQSASASLVNLLQENVDKIAAQLKKLRETHVNTLSEQRQTVTDLSASAGASSARAEFLQGLIAKETASFNAELEELQGKLDIAAENGRCVQELEPCGVQTDKRAKREEEIKALKEAWTALHPEGEAFPEF